MPPVDEEPLASTPTATVFGGPPFPPVASPSPIPYTGDRCFGDETVSIVPEEPKTDNELLIVVTSRYQNKYPRLAGTEKTTFVRERPGQAGYVWEWTIQATWPGQHQYMFYVDSTIPCKKVELMVKRPYYTPTPTPTKTPKPTKTPDSSNDNNSNNDNRD